MEYFEHIFSRDLKLGMIFKNSEGEHYTIHKLELKDMTTIVVNDDDQFQYDDKVQIKKFFPEMM